MKRKHKRLITGILTICLLAMLFPKGVVYAEDELVTEDGFKYQADWSDSKAVNIIGYEGEGGKLTVPAKINGKRVSSVGGFIDNTTITEVIISEGIKTIGSEAFKNCTSLTTVSIPASVESIQYAFSFCSSLQEFTVAKKNKVYYTVDGVLMKKHEMGVTLVSYPGGKEGDYTIPKEVKYIGEQAFYGAANITGVTIPGTCKSIDPNAFDSCTKLSSVVIGKGGVTSLTWKIFANCTSLTKVTIPSTVLFISEGPFMGCSQLTSLDINSKNKLYKVTDGMLVSKVVNNGGIELCELLAGVSLKDGVFTVPKNINAVRPGAFGGIEGLTTIDFSKCKVNEFPSYLFEGFKGEKIIVKKGSKLAESLYKAETIYLEDGVAQVEYVK